MGIRSRNYTVSDAPLRICELFEPMSVPAAVTQFFFMMAYGVIEVYVAIYAASCHLPGGGIYFISSLWPRSGHVFCWGVPLTGMGRRGWFIPVTQLSWQAYCC